jgi:PKD repeat protein
MSRVFTEVGAPARVEDRAMQILPTKWLLPGVFALLVLAAPARAQTPPIKASFTVLPEPPKLGDDVAFTATSTGGGVHAWDLDGDGAFDDATGPKARTQFKTPGLHTVRLRTTNAVHGNSDVATREFSFEGEAAPPPPPGAAPPPRPCRLDRRSGPACNPQS